MKNKVGFVTMEKLGNRKKESVGSARIRGRWLWENWDEAEEWQIGKPYDVIVFQKAYWPEMINEFHGIKIMDLCDPDFLDRCHDKKKATTLGLMDKCDAIVTSTEPLADYLKLLMPHKIIECIPDRVDLKEHACYKKKQSEEIKEAAWIGYSGNFEYVRDAIGILGDNGIKVVTYSDQMIEATQGSNLDLEWRKYQYDGLHERLVEHDAVLLPDNRGNINYRGRFKSNNKATTCWALKIPVIVIPEDLARLKTKEAREKEVEEKYKLVKKKYGVLQSVDEYKNLISKIMKQ